MLQKFNAYFLAKIGADTAENEQHFAENLPKIGNYPTRHRGGARRDERHDVGLLAARRQAPSPAPGGVRLQIWQGWGVRVSKIGKFCKLLQIFSGLVLGFIKTKFCKKICVRQHFSNSIRFAYFCTAAISKC